MERKVSTMFIFSAILALLFSTSYVSFAQESASHPPKHFTAPSKSSLYDGSPDQEMETLKRDLRSQKKQIVAANMNLTDTEAEKFWPVYDRYAADLATIYDTKMALLEEYMDNHKTMNGDEAESYLRRRDAVEEDIMQLRLKYVPAFRKVLSGRQAALFFQIEWRLDLMVNLQLAQMPMFDQ
jgi:Spy/CpxP family protein refolding chaperone